MRADARAAPTATLGTGHALILIKSQEVIEMVGTILLVLLVLLLLGALPAWPHSRSWGYAPSGSLGTVLLVVLVLVLLGRL